MYQLFNINSKPHYKFLATQLVLRQNQNQRQLFNEKVICSFQIKALLIVD